MDKKRLNALKYLTPVDLVVITTYFLLSITHIVYNQVITGWYEYAFYNLLAILLIWMIAFFDKNLKHPIWTHLHNWYLILFVLLTFKQIYFMVDPIRNFVIDDILIKLDYTIFGFHPTRELSKIANPYLTELLQIVYATFFFLPVILGLDLLQKKKMEAFNYAAFMIVYGFMLSFIGYFLFPAIGPRFTLHQFETTNLELPGIFITNLIRDVINTAEGIPAGTLHPASVVQRDVFPSGHTQMTIITMIYAVKFKSNTRWFLIPVGILLIFSTVYLRYHYFVDLLGGVLFMILTIVSGKYIYKSWVNFRGSKFSAP